MRDGQNVVVLFGFVGVLPKLILIGIVIGNMTIGFNFGRFNFPLVFIMKITLPHRLQVAFGKGYDENGNEGEGNQIEQCWLGHIHDEQADKCGNHPKGVKNVGQKPVRPESGAFLQIVSVAKTDKESWYKYITKT